LIRQNKLIGRAGIHLNLSQGEPLTEPIKKYSKFYSYNNMYSSFKGNFLNDEESRIVYRELQAQVDRCKHEGINPSHFDSHHGMHYYWDIGKIIIELALRNKIFAIRLRTNWGNNSKKSIMYSKLQNIRGIAYSWFYSLRGKVYSRLYNNRIKTSGLAKTNYFCDIMNVTPELLSKNLYLEVNTHPYLNNNNILIDCLLGVNLIELTKKYLPMEHFITYKEIE
jgi:predicted glycoside hydrolase/deacetylase ChbG (UPF0249 family)